MKKILAVLVLLTAIYIGYQFIDNFKPGKICSYIVDLLLTI